MTLTRGKFPFDLDAHSFLDLRKFNLPASGGDATQAFIDALAEIQYLTHAGIIIVPPGEWFTSQKILVDGRAVLWGHGPGKTIIRAADTNAFDGDCVVELAGQHHTGLKGLYVLGPATAGTSVSCINVTNAQEACMIDDVWIATFSNRGLNLEGTSVQNFSVRGVQIAEGLSASSLPLRVNNPGGQVLIERLTANNTIGQTYDIAADVFSNFPVLFKELHLENSTLGLQSDAMLTVDGFSGSASLGDCIKIDGTKSCNIKNAIKNGATGNILIDTNQGYNLTVSDLGYYKRGRSGEYYPTISSQPIFQTFLTANLLNGWTAPSTGGVRLYKNGSLATFENYVEGGTITASTPIIQMSGVGFSPRDNHLVGVVVETTPGVFATGTIQIRNNAGNLLVRTGTLPAGTTKIYLGGISWEIAAL